MDGFVNVAKLSEIPEGQARVFEVNGKRVAICQVEGELFAVADLCTHDGGPLAEGELDDHQIECPRHGARFDIKTGKALCLPAVVSIPTYAVKVSDGEVWVGQAVTVS